MGYQPAITRPPAGRRILRAAGAGLAIAGLALVVAWPALGQATADWPQGGGDAAHRSQGDGGEPPYRLAWHAPLDPGSGVLRLGVSQPIIADGLVIALTGEAVTALDAESGQVAWTLPRDLGPAATPAAAAVADRTILLYTEGWAGHAPTPVVSGTPTPSSVSPSASASASPEAGGSTGGPVDSHLVAIDLRTRKPAFDPVELDEVSRSGVAVDGSTAFVADRSGDVVAIDLATGSTRWTAELGAAVDMLPAVSDGTVVVAIQATRERTASIVALDEESGDVRWRRQPVAQLPLAVSIAEGRVVILGADQFLETFDVETGTPGWRATGRNTALVRDAGVAIVGAGSTAGVVAVTTTGLLTRYDLATGERMWDFAINTKVLHGAPVSTSAAILVASEDGAVQAFDPTTGDRVWRAFEGEEPAQGLSLATGRVFVVRGGTQAGVDGLEHWPQGSLVRVISPTVFDPMGALLAFTVVALPLVALSWFLNRRYPVGSIAVAGSESDDPLEGGEEE